MSRLNIDYFTPGPLLPSLLSLQLDSLRKKSRPHDPTRHVQLALDMVKEEGTPPTSRKYKKRDDGRPKVQIRIGDDEESEEEGDKVDSGRDDLNENGEYMQLLYLIQYQRIQS